MKTGSGVEIDAPAAEVWDVFSDVERWPEWTASVTRLVALDGRVHAPERDAAAPKQRRERTCSGDVAVHGQRLRSRMRQHCDLHRRIEHEHV